MTRWHFTILPYHSDYKTKQTIPHKFFHLSHTSLIIKRLYLGEPLTSLKYWQSPINIWKKIKKSMIQNALKQMKKYGTGTNRQSLIKFLDPDVNKSLTDFANQRSSLFLSCFCNRSDELLVYIYYDLVIGPSFLTFFSKECYRKLFSLVVQVAMTLQYQYYRYFAFLKFEWHTTKILTTGNNNSWFVL